MQENNQLTPADTTSGRPGTGRRFALYGAMAMAAPLFFAISTPRAVPSVLLIAGFLILAVSVYGMLRLLLVVSGLEQRLPAAYRRGIVAIGTVLPVLLLMLQSIGQLTLRDVLTLGGICMLGIFYIGRITTDASR